MFRKLFLPHLKLSCSTFRNTRPTRTKIINEWEIRLSTLDVPKHLKEEWPCSSDGFTRALSSNVSSTTHVRIENTKMSTVTFKNSQWASLNFQKVLSTVPVASLGNKFQWASLSGRECLRYISSTKVDPTVLEILFALACSQYGKLESSGIEWRQCGRFRPYQPSYGSLPIGHSQQSDHSLGLCAAVKSGKAMALDWEIYHACQGAPVKKHIGN